MMELQIYDIEIEKGNLWCHNLKSEKILLIADATNLSPHDWISCNVKKIKDHEYYATDIKKMWKDESISPLICSFDIETYSPKGFRGKTPGNLCFMMSLVFKRLHEKEISYVITTCDLKSQAEVFVVEDEFFMVKKFIELLKLHNPSYITGYNILSFDLPFLKERIDALDKEWPGEHIPQDISWKFGRWNKKGLTLNIPGMVFMDLMVYFSLQKEYLLENHKLDTVALKLLNKGKDPVDFRYIFKSYTSKCPEMLSTVAKYCIKDSLLCCMLIEKMAETTHELFLKSIYPKPKEHKRKKIKIAR